MKLPLLGAFAFFVSALASSAEDKVTLVPAFANISNVNITKPINVVIPPDGTNRHFLVQQRGKVVILPQDDNGTNAKVFLDLTHLGMEAKDGQFEEGLIGFAFHPKFKENGKFYVCHSAQDMKRNVYAEYHVSADNPDKADPTGRVLLEVPEPFWNHNSGCLAFGPDGYLYLTLGDGGKGGDPLRTAQNPFNLLGKVLRIDVDRTQGSRAYGIPQDNPLVGQPGVREEIYALGMRNPWGLHFEADGTLWCADVGQELFEEINLIEKGGNYGWSYREGTGPYPARTDAPPEGSQFIDPIHTYNHTQGISISGGVIYRGTKLPELQGCYIYADWGFGTIWALKYDKAKKQVVSNTQLLGPQIAATDKNAKNTGFKPTAICEDANHELLALDWMGKIWHIAPKP